MLLRGISQHVSQGLGLPRLSTSQVLLITDHAPFSTRQFAGSVALFAVLYFIAVAVGKWVLYLSIPCLNSLLSLSLAYEYLVGRLRGSSLSQPWNTAYGLSGTHLVCSLLIFSAGWWLEPVVSFAIFRKDA